MSDQKIGWFSAPGQRGTMTIIYTCFKALVIPLYSSIHVDISAHPTKTSTRFARRISWVLLGLYMPEIMVAFSLAQYMEARATRRDSLFQDWTLTHGFYVIMGGFVLVSEDGTRRTATYQQLLRLKEPHPFMLVPIERITKEQIMDKSKSDALVKGIAVAQVLYFLGQHIGRLLQGLPVTSLEVATVAYVPIAGLTYALWWSKPQDVVYPHEIRIARLDVDSIPGWPGSESSSLLDIWRSVYIGKDVKPTLLRRNGFVAFLVAAICGSIPLAYTAYKHFSLPTRAEHVIWFMANSYAFYNGILCQMILSWISASRYTKLVSESSGRQGSPLRSWWAKVLRTHYFYLCFYAAARITILFEGLYSLRSLPPGAFDQPDWLQYLPS